MNILEKLILRIIKYRVSNWFALERSLTESDNVYNAAEDSPEKSWPNPEKITGGKEVPFSLKNFRIVGPSLISCISQGTKAIKSVEKNPQLGQQYISQDDLNNFEELAKLKGIGAIGYAKMPPHLIFKDRAVLFDTAIVLVMEMDEKAIMQAPSPETFKMVMSTYDILGKTTNLLTGKLREMGFQAQASHPLGGLVLYPPLAVEAGMGWFGRHGLLITPQFGPRQRIAAIFANIDNLPIARENSHSWIKDFCSKCGRCIRTCPAHAIMEIPIEHKSGRKTHICRDKCLPVFNKEQGCTLCIKECSFTRQGYSEIREIFQKKIDGSECAN